MPLLNKTIKFVIVRNPFVPDSRFVVERDYECGKSLHDYIGDLNEQYTIIHNGQHVEQTTLTEILPQAGDVIGIAPIPAGGGGGNKSVMRLVAVVALAVVTAGVGSVAAGFATTTLGMTAGGAGAMMFAAGAAAVVGIGGSLLINRLLPPTVASSASSSSQESSTYGIDGAKNTSTEGVVVPVTYGSFRTAGNIVAMHTTMNGQDQWLHMLINAGEGVIATFDPSTVQINEQPLSDFGSDAKVWFMHGNAGQNCYSEFSAQITPNQVLNNRDIVDETWSSYESSIDAEIEAVEVGLVNQIYRVDDNGNIGKHTVNAQIEFRRIGQTAEGDWADIRSGLKRKYYGLGWYFTSADGVKGMFDPDGATVTKKKIGSQLIDPTRPNKFDVSSNLYKNYYTFQAAHYEKSGRRKIWVDDRYILNGERVSTSGDTVVKVSGYWSNSGGTSIWVPLIDAARDLPASSVPNTKGLTSYDYGYLICDGKRVGIYHDFHQTNPDKPTYNGGWMELGTKYAEKSIVLGGNTTSAQRVFYRSPRLPEGRYEVRVRRIGTKSTDTRKSEVITFNEVNEILYADVDYNYTALLQLSIKATSNISSVPRVTFINKGRVIRVWDEAARRFVPSYKSKLGTYGNRVDYKVLARERAQYPILTSAQNAIYSGNEFGGNLVPNVLAWSTPAHLLSPSDDSFYDTAGYRGHSNPAWIVYDMLTDRRVGGGLSPSRVDFWAFKEWAAHCEANGLFFNGVFDSTETLWDQLAKVFRVGRANPIRVGTRYSVAIEKPSLEVMRFGQDNIKEGSFSVNWLSATDRANEVEVTFYDKNYDYKQRVIKVYDKNALNNGEKAITSSITLQGVTDYDQAVREANFALNANKLVETVSFTTSVSSLACTVGDVVRVQHNMMDWGEAGKIKSVVPLPNGKYSIKLDHEIRFDTDQWSILIHHDYASKGAFVVKSKADMYVTLTGFRDSNTTATRIMVNGQDVGIVSTFVSSDGSGDCGVCVEDPALFAVGNTVELFAVNTYETASIQPATLSEQTDTVIATLSSAPATLSSFMIGKLNYTSKLFTVRSIGLASDSLERSVTCLEYDERVYDDQNTDFVITEESAFFALAQVEDVTIIETSRFENNVEQIDLAISWSHPDERYKDAEVFVRTNRTKETSIGHHISNAIYTAQVSDELSIRIVPYDALNKPGKAKIINYDVEATGGDIASSKPTGGSITATSGGSKLKVTAANMIGVKRVEVWAIIEGTMINGQPINSTIAATLTGADVEEAGELLGYAADNGEFVHVAETEASLSKSYYYYTRAISFANIASDMTYIGVSKPVSSIIYNTVTVYCLSALTPPTPVGGTYANPVPDGTAWLHTAPTRSEGDDSSELWMSVRRFCNFIESQDPVWSEPSIVSTPIAGIVRQITKTWVAYADDPTGTNISFTYDPAHHLYRGVAYNMPSSETPSLVDPSVFTWQLIIFLTDIVSSEQRNILNAMKEGKLVDQTQIATTPALQQSIDTALTQMTEYADAGLVGASKYAELQRSINGLKNASFELPFTDTYPYWILENVNLTNLELNAGVGSEWTLKSGNTGRLKQVGIIGNEASNYALITQQVSAVPGVTYGFSVYSGAHRCKMRVSIDWMDINGVKISTTDSGTIDNNDEMMGGVTLDKYKRIYTYGVAPTNTAYAKCVIIKFDTKTGQTDSWAFFTHAQFGEWTSGQTQPPAWCPGIEPLIADRQIAATKIAIGAITANEIAASTITGSRIAANTITGANIAANTITATQIAANTITSSKLAAGSITADKIVGGAITASKLAVSDMSNLCYNGKGDSLDGWRNSVDGGLASNGAFYGYWSGVGVASDWALNFQERDTFFGALFQVRPGDQFYVSADTVPFGGEASSVYFGIGFRFVDQGGNTAGWPTIGRSAGSYGYVKLSGTIAAPSNAAKAEVFVIVDGAGGTLLNSTGVGHHVTNIEIRRKSAGELIVDGAITAAKIAAGTITATQIASSTITGDRIAASTITGSKIAADTITAANILAGTITATEIAAGTITASKLAAGTITGDKIAAGQTLSSPNISGGQLSMGSWGTYNWSFQKDGHMGIGGGGGPYSAWGYGWNTMIWNDGTIQTNRLYASGGTFDNVTINSNCDVRGTIYADKIVGDVVAVKNYNIAYMVKVRDMTFISGTIAASTKTRLMMVSKIKLLPFSTGTSDLHIFIYIDGAEVYHYAANYSGFVAEPPPLVVAAGANRSFSIRSYSSNNAYYTMPPQDIQITVAPQQSGTFI